MIYFAIIISLMIINLSFYIYYFYKAKKRTVLIFKMATSFWFVLLGITATFLNKDRNNNYALMMIMGLISGFLGDAMLGLRGVFPENKKIYFILGLLLFFIGHIFYSSVIITLGTYKLYLYLFLGLILTIITIIVLELTKVQLGKLRVVNYIYLFVSACLLSITTLNFLEIQNIGSIITFVGVVFFVTSDFILCYLYFKKMDFKIYKRLKLINILTYYIGQVLLALSIYFII